MDSHQHQGTTSSALTRLNVNVARLLGVPPSGYTHLLGMAPEHLNDDLYRTPAATTARLAELASHHVTWPEVAILLARQSGVGALGVWDYLITAAATPLDGIRDASAYFAAVADPNTDALHITEDGEHITISHWNKADLAHEAACTIRAYALGLYQKRLGETARRRLTPVRVALAAKAPRRHDVLTELYGTRTIDFETPDSSITFLASDLKVSSPHVQPGLSTVLQRHAEQHLAAAIPLHNWLDHFRTALASAHDEATPTLATVARRMKLSTRTLQRRLDEQGTTWSCELETLRRAHVTRLLETTDLSIASIATRSGYSDAGALRRAVQRWYGTTPASLRHSRRGSLGRNRGRGEQPQLHAG
ncbi:helix-turn-helix domain-containing protein [Streptomyces sp. NPDC008265]|uniref:helix-turn-helix domain-containing protein n=1 Tax=Streptomyces sp. NPDC008265 TaxID=3364824 RepID=UPI0036E80F28